MNKKTRNLGFMLVTLITLLTIDATSSQSIQLSQIYITWENHGTQTDFMLTIPFGDNIERDNFWVGVGLNSAPVMQGASAVVCKLWNKHKAIHHYLNDPFVYNTKLFDSKNPSLGITNEVITLNDNNLTCSFTRQNANPINHYYDLNKNPKPNLIVAYGKASTSKGDIQFHSYQETSVAISNFAPRFNLWESLKRKNRNNLAHSKVATYTMGPFSFFWKDSQNSTSFSIITEVKNKMNVYSAIGFSNDQSMGDDDVCVCVYSKNLTNVIHYYNKPGQPIVLDSRFPSIGISNIKISLKDGLMTCSFTRLKAMPSVKNYYDLNKPYYLLSATGSTDNFGALQKHTTKMASQTEISFLDEIHQNYKHGLERIFI